MGRYCCLDGLSKVGDSCLHRVRVRRERHLRTGCCGASGGETCARGVFSRSRGQRDSRTRGLAQPERRAEGGVGLPKRRRCERARALLLRCGRRKPGSESTAVPGRHADSYVEKSGIDSRAGGDSCDRASGSYKVPGRRERSARRQSARRLCWRPDDLVGHQLALPWLGDTCNMSRR